MEEDDEMDLGDSKLEVGIILEKRFEVDRQIDPDPVMFALGWLWVVRFLEMPSSLIF